MTVRILQGDCRDVLKTLPDESVHCVVTSPPYWGLRDYGHQRQIGLEVSPVVYVEALVSVFSEVRRVLKRDGTLWLNVDDRTRHGRAMLIPERLVLALERDGWFPVSTIIWAKAASNGPFIGTCLPDGSGRRPDRSFEPVFMLSKSREYHYDALAVREASDPKQVAHNNRYAKTYDTHTAKSGLREPGNVNHVGIHGRPSKDGKRGLRSVWTINTQPYPGDHGAVMPERVAELCILAGCPVGGAVLDPFGGAGTTGLVADRQGRDAVLIELNSEYAKTAERRIYGDAPLLTPEAV